ncbi:hypothetical protein CYANOKiyG1_46630 [Okeania sp. KiyG1]|nr:hypothetical protein CYANOKiyG1_46630 [Okeania sp. KiyG1]
MNPAPQIATAMLRLLEKSYINPPIKEKITAEAKQFTIKWGNRYGFWLFSGISLNPSGVFSGTFNLGSVYE